MPVMKCVWTAFLFFLVVLRPQISGAQEEVLRFPVTNWQPFTIGTKPPFAGIDVDIAREVAKRLNFQLDLRACPFKRCLKSAENGQLDLVSGVAFNEERAQYLDYFKESSYGDVSVAFYVQLGQAAKIASYEDLRRYWVGLVRGSHYFEPFNSDTVLRKYEAPTEVALLPILAAGRVDAIIGTNPNLDYQILQAGYKGKFEPAQYDPQQKVPIYFALSKKSPHLKNRERIQAVLDDIRNDGTLKAIYARYR